MVSKSRTIDTQLLRAFVAIATCKGFTPAAVMLGIAKSAVSKQLLALEEVLGMRLFERTSRRVLLTKEGQLLLSRAESILAELDQFSTDAQEEKVQVRGAVRVAASPEFGAFLAQYFLPLLLARHPALKITMTLEYSLEDLQDPNIDLAFRIGKLGDDRLIGRHLGDFARVLVCSAGYATRNPINAPDALERSNCLLFSDQAREATWRVYSASSPVGERDIPVNGNLTVQGFTAMSAAAIAGVGVARLPLFVVASALTDGRLVRILPEWHCAPAPVHLAYRRGVSRIARIRAVIDAAMQEVPHLLASIPAVDAVPMS